MIEVWKDIPGYDGKYQASNLGRIKGKQKVLTPQISNCGYHKVCLSVPPGSATKTVHRLLALTFLKYPLDKSEQVNHKDGIKTNNIISNLEICNNSENAKHAYKLGLNKNKKGQLSARSVVNNRDVIHIRDEFDKLKSKMTTRVAIAKIANGYNISYSLTDKICFRTKWKHV